MINSHLTPQNVSLPGAPSAAQQAERNRARFAVALPALMAVLLALVPVAGQSVGVMVLLTLVPLTVWFAVTDTEKALYVYFAWCWMDGTIRGLFDSSAVSILARDVLMGIIVLGWGLRRLPTREQNPIRLPPGSLLIGLFVVNCVIQVANPYSLGLTSCIAGFKMHLAFLPLMFLGYDVFRRGEQVRAFLIFLTLATLVISAVSVVQYSQGPNWTYSHFPGSKDVISQNTGILNPDQDAQVTTFKPPGTTTFGGGTGGFVGVILPLTFGLVLLSQRSRVGAAGRAVLIGVIFAFIVTMFLNGVRSGFVTGVVGVMICGFLAGGRNAARVLAVGGVCLVMGLIGWSSSQSLSNGHVADRFSSTLADPTKALHEDRATFFDQFGYLITKAPLGVGLGRVGAAGGQFDSDPDGLSSAIFSEAYLGDIMAETGITGAILILCTAVLFVLHGFNCLKYLADPDDRLMAVALLSVLLVILANFFVTPILLGLPGGPVFWMCAAMLLRAYAPETSRPPAAARRPA